MPAIRACTRLMISGPIGGLMGARYLGDKLGLKRIVTADMGGTSFDVGLVVDGRLTIQRSADIAGHRLALPMVQLDSIGSGAGSEVRLDQYKRLARWARQRRREGWAMPRLRSTDYHRHQRGVGLRRSGLLSRRALKVEPRGAHSRRSRKPSPIRWDLTSTKPAREYSTSSICRCAICFPRWWPPRDTIRRSSPCSIMEARARFTCGGSPKD